MTQSEPKKSEQTALIRDKYQRARRSGCHLKQEKLLYRSQNHRKLKMDIKRVKDYIYWLYYQYLLVTCSYVLEPWEQSMFHTITVTVVAMVVYTAYVFVPIHVRLALEFFSQIFGGQPESTVSIMN